VEIQINEYRFVCYPLFLTFKYRGVFESRTVSEQDGCEAHALYDFVGRTERELSFKKGTQLVVFEKVSGDWWEGAVEGKDGLIPDKYINVKQSYVSILPPFMMFSFFH